MSSHGLGLSNTKWRNSGVSRKGSSASRRKLPSDNGNTAGSRKPFSTIHSMSDASGDRTVKKLRLTKALTMPDSVTVLDACKRMAARKVDAALLTDSSTLLCGIITDKDVTTRVIAEALKPEEVSVARVMTRNPAFVLSDTLAVEALQKMVQGKFRHLPVVEDGEVTAILDITKCLYDAIARMERAAEKGDAIAAAVEGIECRWGNADFGIVDYLLSSFHEGKLFFYPKFSFISGAVNLVETLREKMFRPSLGSIIQEGTKVLIVSPSDTIYTVARKMRDLRVNSAIVSMNNKPHGIVTSKDILMRLVCKNLPAESTIVEQIMTPNPVCATIDISIMDALHVMHDGKFLHLPVIDECNGFVISCLDVLQLTHAAIAIVGADAGENVESKNIMLQKFWDSAVLQEPHGEDDIHSDASITKSYADDFGLDQIKYSSAATFSFKLEDSKGHVHRFQSGSESLTELMTTISQRLEIDNNQPPLITYLDEEGDHIVLLTDNDLVAAINNARLQGWKTLKLHLGFQSSTERTSFTEEKTHQKAGNSCLKIDNHESWASPISAVAIMGVAILAGISFVICMRRANV